MEKVLVKDESQVNGGEAAEKAEEGLPFELKGEADLERLFDEHPKFLKEFEEIGAQKFIEKYGESEQEGETAPEDQGQEENWLADEKPVEPEKKPEDVKPETEKIAEGELKSVKDELTAAKQEIENLKKAATPSEKKELEKAEKEIDLSNLTELPEDIDLITEDGQKAAKKQIQSLTKTVKELADVIKNHKERFSEIKEVRTEVDDIKQAKEKEEKSKAREDHVESEFEQIDRMVKARKDVFGEEVRSIKAIEADYLEAVEDMLKEVIKTDAPLCDEKGLLSKEANKAIELYNGDTDKAKRFQAKCKELKIGFPEDIELLNTVYQIRGIRKELSHKDEAGNIVKAIPYEHALNAYIGKNLSKFQNKTRLESRDARERAIANRKKFAPETKPSSGAAVDEDVVKVPQSERLRLLEKPWKERTEGEKQMVYHMLLLAGEPDIAAKHLAGIDRKD